MSARGRGKASRWPVVVLAHAGLLTAAYWLAYALRFDFSIPDAEWSRFFVTLPLLLAIKLTVFGAFHLYDRVWRFIGMRDLLAIFRSVSLGSLAFTVATLLTYGYGVARSVFILDWVLSLALIGGTRLSLRALTEARVKRVEEGRRAVIVGAGNAAERLIREIQGSDRFPYEIVGMVDDDRRLRGRRIHGVEVLGPIESLPRVCSEKKAQEVLIAIPSAPGEQLRRIAEMGKSNGLVVKTVPALRELLDGTARIGQLVEVTPEDLLGRRFSPVDSDVLRGALHGKRILVTGAAGSIGSELCRQIAAFEPEELLLFDRAESNLYFTDLELQERHPDTRIVPVVGDILDRAKLAEVMSESKPQLVYHAAAYKHVPLMEKYPADAILNNVFGTEYVARAAIEHGVDRFVLISTDKAVDPVGMMGRSKRMAESLLLTLEGAGTTFIVTRFGNVLGSEGSVLPLFQWQISQGGPVTVTDLEASRYFMLMSEAAQLVLQAGAAGDGGQIYFLDMGEPILIADLAENLIRMSGYTPGEDIKIEEIGLREGERLTEELHTMREELVPSKHEKIFVSQKKPFSHEEFGADLELLRKAVSERDPAAAVETLKQMADRY